jgi:hypothetical protein
MPRNEVSNLKEEIRILKQHYELAKIIISGNYLNGNALQRLFDLELMEVVKEYAEFKYRRAHEK